MIGYHWRAISVTTVLFASVFLMSAHAQTSGVGSGQSSDDVQPIPLDNRRQFIDAFQKSAVENCDRNAMSQRVDRGLPADKNFKEKVERICYCTGIYISQNITDAEIRTLVQAMQTRKIPNSSDLVTLINFAMKHCFE